MGIEQHVTLPWEEGDDDKTSEKTRSAEEELREQFNLPENAGWTEITEAARNFDVEYTKALTLKESLRARYNLSEDTGWEDIANAAREEEE